MNAVEQAIPAIGQAYRGGFVTGITRDPETGERHLWITAGAAYELEGRWGEFGEKIQGADSHTNSRANTEAMAAAGSELAKQVLALEIGGYSDWAIPARDVQELQYRHFKPTTEASYCWNRDGDNPNSEPVGLLYTEESPGQTVHEMFRAGAPEAFQRAWYWSSSQRSANLAFNVYFADGTQGSFGKSDELRVRPIRSEIIQ
ncbi:TPA: DUF1566 domain-containing protein [Pseudomonas putida]|nr:DUF1566 domain-containing protein [Pseudomonas putida]